MVTKQKAQSKRGSTGQSTPAIPRVPLNKKDWPPVRQPPPPPKPLEIGVAPVQIVGRIISMQGEARAVETPEVKRLASALKTMNRPTDVRYEQEVDPREQGFRIVSAQPIRKYAITYWLDGVLQHHEQEATSEDEACLLVRKMVEERNDG